MMVRFTASNIVAMILFIPLLLALGIILAFIVPVLALVVAVAGIVFLCLFVFAKMGLVKKQQVSIGSSRSEKGKATIDVKDYKIKQD